MKSNQKLRQAIGTPKSEIKIDTDLVLNLLQQHSDLIHLPIQLLENGWDNVIFRLGHELSVRLPRREIAATLIENEQTWLPQIAHRLTIPVPTPYRIGQPTPEYPWRWSILPWRTGVAAGKLLRVASPTSHVCRMWISGRFR